MIKALEVFSNKMNELKYDYSYFQKDSDIHYPYLVGNSIEYPLTDESVTSYGQITLHCFTRGKMLELLEINEKIKKELKEYRQIIDDVAVILDYSDNQEVDTGDIDLKRIDIHITFYEWEAI